MSEIVTHSKYLSQTLKIICTSLIILVILICGKSEKTKTYWMLFVSVTFYWRCTVLKENIVSKYFATMGNGQARKMMMYI